MQLENIWCTRRDHTSWFYVWIRKNRSIEFLKCRIENSLQEVELFDIGQNPFIRFLANLIEVVVYSKNADTYYLRHLTDIFCSNSVFIYRLSIKDRLVFTLRNLRKQRNAVHEQIDTSSKGRLIWEAFWSSLNLCKNK